ncbi:MAG: DUF1959 domain-containing protein [Methanobrevibacter sp.]|nr:DUF1959 domain-containing protein [Methanobrevibacter sp.]
MDDEARLELMKKRIVGSYAWQRDLIVPLSKDFDCTTDELETLFFDLLDMSELESMHGRFETAQYSCLLKKLYADLRLCWFADSMELISKDDARELTEKLANEIINGKDYSDVLKEGQKELFTILKNSR